jgi:hypothetical protein
VTALARRRLLAGAASLPAVAVAAHAAVPPPHPDAELVRRCESYLLAVEAFEASPGDLELEDDPLWLAVDTARIRMGEIEPATMAGVVALAAVAEHLARQPDGGENFSASFTGDLPERVVRAVLNLSERA